MAYPDSVTQANVKVLGDSPAIALGNLYQATAQALANAAHNATSAQQQAAITAQAATTMGVTTLYCHGHCLGRWYLHPPDSQFLNG